MNAASELLQISQDLLLLNFIVFLRVGPIMALFPGFGERSVPARIKLALALLFTVVISPAVSPLLSDIIRDPPPVPLLVVTETAIGLVIGVGIRMFLLALQTAGSIAAQSTSLSQLLGTAGVTPLPAVGHILMVGGLALAMILGLHVRLAEMVVLTYGLFAVAQFPDASAITPWGVRQVAGAFALAFTLAAPFVIISVLYNLTLGIINRAMPQLMVVFVGAPVIVAGGLTLLLFVAPTILTIWVQALNHFIGNPFGGS